MAFCRNPQHSSKAIPQSNLKKPNKQQSSASASCQQGAVLSSIRHLPQNQRDWSESMRHLLRQLLQEENRSMEAMLNSSINHFTRYMTEHEDIETQNHQLIRQNQRLTIAIEELRTILRQKLEASLKKQREDLNMMMQDYIQLIEKLLSDKEAFAQRIEEEAERANLAQELLDQMVAHQEVIRQEQEYREKVIEALQVKLRQKITISDEKDLKIAILKKQNEELKVTIRELQLKQTIIQQKQYPDSYSYQQDPNSEKTTILVQLLEKSEAEAKNLRERLRALEGGCRNELVEQFKIQLRQTEEQHQQQFTQYQQSMREVLKRKDEQIQKLTKALQNSRSQLSQPQANQKINPFSN